MLILMDADHKKEQLDRVVAKIEELGFKPHVLPGAQSTAVGITGNSRPLDPRIFEQLEGVKQAIPVTKPYKLAGRDFAGGDTRIPVGAAPAIGGETFVVMAGPCAVESEEQTVRIAKLVKARGAHFLRGGAFKPRTSPYAFQGLGEDGLKILKTAREETGLPVITEALDQPSLTLVYKYADIIQIGARNMQNFALLKEAGKLDKPVMLKRGLSATIDEWLMSAEYIMSEGNKAVMLCERGIRTFSSHTRNTLDLNAVPVVQKLSHLPVIVDPSHGTGLRDKVAPLARASAAVGAHGVMIEVHDRPHEALCDGPQAMSPDAFESLMGQLRRIAAALDFKL
ncbi:MAG: 3-deoxy-7-phosphoheptulonate synthase [Elusimicrobia bacterium CG1_02_63_36]|nr:MAG: 3-deoxy-7-phosphoheptulonate synthase [Elusimicrobia bacterium CG1_02_63_36]PIP83657.1 MAG: 3-deoxy-7-phosphoheptulonate synthase [Elusimicrobia bacterium CG22_combo_CG10-13_8_21_14_all_63_91]PJA12812.1 MAG: 3-deoxy-7-phosphoheptulonate synthase [Elusimicrobia bacterium CG_4_10_14_0_2_um_filter_63_34]PJB26107.1 MAG: 3-deoxy-7-phosphoheptulonate synthase [Elusimicrobia bacterium CG_4_9_14_3_um_filter_62_55]